MKKKPNRLSPSVMYLSCFGLGFAPFAPGTVASIATTPLLYLLVKYQTNSLYFGLVFLIIFAISIYLSEQAQNKYAIHDPSWIVIDEFLGLLTIYPFIKDGNWIHVILALALFRFFDIVKIWPASYFDKKVKHGAGIIIDDIISGIMAGIIILIINYFKFIP